MLVALAAGAYALARETSLFAIRTVEVLAPRGPAASQVRRALAGERGTSLVGLNDAAVLARAETVPWVASASIDRAFPHTLRVRIRQEHPVAVLRRGRDSWLVSARGRVLVRLAPHRRPGLPRIWVRAATPVELGERLPDAEGGAAARALAPLLHAPLHARVRTVALDRGELEFALGSGVQIRLGRPTDLRLKLAIARHLVGSLPAQTAYLDLSVPERPVAGPAPTGPVQNSQVSG